MAEHSLIEWTDATWNPITGCSVVSPGCTNCYAMRLAGTRLQHHKSRAGLTVKTKAGPVWNGKVRLNEEWLDLPLRWRRPRRIFVCAHGDLFHPEVPSLWIDEVHARMAATPHHTYQVLTKRPERAREYYTQAMGWGEHWLAHVGLSHGPMWPLPNVWLGVSVEDQARANERIPDLLSTPAAIRFLSCEPLLAPIDLRTLRPDGINFTLDALTGVGEHLLGMKGRTGRIHWVIDGGESGPGWRDVEDVAFRSLRDQCAAAGTAYFHKQQPNKAPIPEDLRVRQFPQMVVAA